MTGNGRAVQGELKCVGAWTNGPGGGIEGKTEPILAQVGSGWRNTWKKRHQEGVRKKTKQHLIRSKFKDITKGEGTEDRPEGGRLTALTNPVRRPSSGGSQNPPLVSVSRWKSGKRGASTARFLRGELLQGLLRRSR